MYIPPFVHLLSVKMWMPSIGGNEISAYSLPLSWGNMLAYHGGYGPRTSALPKQVVVRTKDESMVGQTWECM